MSRPREGTLASVLQSKLVLSMSMGVVSVAMVVAVAQVFQELGEHSVLVRRPTTL